MEDKELLEAIRGIVKEEVSEIKNQQKENAQILKAIEERTEVNSAKLDKIEHNIAQIQGDVLELKAVTKENLFAIAKLKSTR
ncbi:hypothetical protein MWH25_01190 [Natroniella acetigena]|uniref:hypothetical protein n=1 Tax=Natroniella acetigena TaxID=52004 RepID=UPI00200B4562|nr:hypothetical protein [Natroniella acetigena]MCK8826361.1 hypothetical protein [Natroniella acetigena]